RAGARRVGPRARPAEIAPPCSCRPRLMLRAVEKVAGGALAEPIHAVSRLDVLLHFSEPVAFNIVDELGGSPIAPLFEEERNTRRRALVSERAEPIGMRGPRARPALSAGDHPTEPRGFLRLDGDVLDGGTPLAAQKVPIGFIARHVSAVEHQPPEQRLGAHPPDRRWRFEQERDALVGARLILRRYAEPHVG